MKVKLSVAQSAVAAIAMVATATLANGAIFTYPVTGWAVHNGTSTVGGTASAPTFTPGDNITLMAPFDDIELANDGDYVEVTTKLTLNARTANTGTNALNTQLRVGIFNGPAGAVVASDIPNLGFIIEYSTLGGLIREQTSAVQTNPFTSPTNLTPTGSVDSDAISGANPPQVTFTLRMTRVAGELDLLGSISGGNHLSNYVATSHSSANFPANGSFNFNRIGLFLGGNVDATSASLAVSQVETNVPEPQSICLAALAAVGGVAMRSRRRSELSRG